MNKSAIQKYAIWARNELRDQIAKRGYYFGIDADGINVDGKDETCVYARDGRLLTDTERKQRNELFRLVKEKGFDQVVEEVSYTWFNRLIALRFMEVNDYLPEHIRVLSNANNEFKPEIKTRALDLEDPHFDKKKILDLIDKNDDEELYRYLLLTECNALNDILPQMFEKIGGYTELLLPNNLLKADSVIGKLVNDIDEADWDVKSEGGQVQIIGWLYQYYNQELKDQTFNDLKKKNKKISKERIPAATQLFTPDWIVHYMVENSLGRMWVEGHPNDELKSTWKYYLEEAEQEPEVEEQLKEIRKEYSKLNPQDIKFLDPAMGSGHILVVAFDILMQIYESQGIRPREAAKSILENNLYGLDIDDRAAQLAYFAVMMKAREYDRKIFSRGIQPNLYSIQESNGIDDSLIDYVARGDKKLRSDLKTLVKEMKDAKEYGSIITVSELDYKMLGERIDKLKNDPSLLDIEAIERITSLVKVGSLLAQKYEIICTNPPYMGNPGMDSKLSTFVKQNYPNSKMDLFAVFLEKCIQILRKNGISGLITQHSWMFLPSLERLRKGVLHQTVLNMAHLGANAFDEIAGEVVQTTAFIVIKETIANHKGVYIKLINYKSENEKQYQLLHSPKKYIMNQSDYYQIPGAPISYWVNQNIYKAFSKGIPLGDIAPTKKGLDTGNNDLFLRYWYEVNFQKIGIGYPSSEAFSKAGKKWAPHDKGGSFRRWYGNKEWIINWENNGYEIHNSKANLRSESLYFKQAITWNSLSSGDICFRESDYGAISNTAGSSLYPDKNWNLYLLGLLNTRPIQEFVNILSPTLNYSAGPVAQIPILIDEHSKNSIEKLAIQNIRLSRNDWDESELSWDFKFHPLVSPTRSNSIQKELDNWNEVRDKRGIEIRSNENKLNEISCSLYGITSLLADGKDLSKNILTDDIKGLISYSVGTIFGRFSLDSFGIQCSSPEITLPPKSLIKTDSDNIIPIGEDEYFSDDLAGSFIDWLKKVYGEESLEENLGFIANALGGPGTPREVIRKYFLKDFFIDHCRMYKKRPIYWLFDSGKKNGFKCLIYMHRYTPDTLARIRTDYVHEQQERYRSQIKHIQETIDTVSKSEQVKMKKELKDLEAKSKEVAVFEEKLHHLADQMIEIDLDDGVKHNYALFQDVLAKIK